MIEVPETFEVEFENGIATLWLNRPEKRNAMGPQFFAGLPIAMEVLGQDKEVRVVILSARGPHFSVGLDLTSLASLDGSSQSNMADTPSQAQIAANTHKQIVLLQNSISSVEQCSKPVIAAIHGYCIGGGVDLISACDIRLCADDAIFSVRETKMAMVADIGSLQRLPFIISAGNLAELAFTGKDIDAKRAQEIGLVNSVHEGRDNLYQAAQSLANEIASNSPMAVVGTKNVLRAARKDQIQSGLDYVASWNAAFLRSNDLVEAVTAFFQKRPPEFKGN